MFSSSFVLIVVIAIDDEGETAWYDIDAEGIIIMAMDDECGECDDEDGEEEVASAMVMIRLPREDDGNMTWRLSVSWQSCSLVECVIRMRRTDRRV